MTTDEREAAQASFMQPGRKVVMLATNAFGLGIDKPDIRYIIHYQMPGSPEAYVQEAGRAGRDGKPARCVLLFQPDDIAIQEHFLKEAHPTKTQARMVAEGLYAWSDEGKEVSVRDLALSMALPERRVRVILSVLEAMGVAQGGQGGALARRRAAPDARADRQGGVGVRGAAHLGSAAAGVAAGVHEHAALPRADDARLLRRARGRQVRPVRFVRGPRQRGVRSRVGRRAPRAARRDRLSRAPAPAAARTPGERTHRGRRRRRQPAQPAGRRSRTCRRRRCSRPRSRATSCRRSRPFEVPAPRRERGRLRRGRSGPKRPKRRLRSPARRSSIRPTAGSARTRRHRRPRCTGPRTASSTRARRRDAAAAAAEAPDGAPSSKRLGRRCATPTSAPTPSGARPRRSPLPVTCGGNAGRDARSARSRIAPATTTRASNRGPHRGTQRWRRHGGGDGGGVAAAAGPTGAAAAAAAAAAVATRATAARAAIATAIAARACPASTIPAATRRRARQFSSGAATCNQATKRAMPSSIGDRGA